MKKATSMLLSPRFHPSPRRAKAKRSIPHLEELESRLAPAAPVVLSINRMTPALPNTSAASVQYAVTFDQAVTGVDAADFKVSTTGALAANSNVALQGNGASYSVTVNGIHGDGQLRLDLIDNDSIVGAGLALGGPGQFNGSFQGQSYSVLPQILPVVESINRTTPFAQVNNATSVDFAVTFNEPVTGVDPADFKVVGMVGAAVQQVTPLSASNYTVVVNGIAGDGALGLNLVDNGTIHDLDSNSLTTPNTRVDFANAVTYATSGRPFTVASMDLNGDGIPDLAVANSTSASAGVLLGNGDGTFQAEKTFATGNGPTSVVLGDINGDGHFDLIATNRDSDSVSLLLGNGNGTFQSPRDVNMPKGPYMAAVGDLNRDGKSDLVVANRDSNIVSVLLGNGNGSFQAQKTFATDPTLIAVALQDVNGDDKPDLAISSLGNASVRVLLGNGDGSFQTPQNLVTGASPTATAVGDVNRDGKPDLVVVNSSDSGNVLLGNGDGTFQARQTFAAPGFGPTSSTLADVNRDGKADLTVSYYFSQSAGVLLGNGDGTFQAQQTFAAGRSPQSTIPPDLNADGSPDIVVANELGNSVSVLLSNSVSSGVNGDFTGQAYTITQGAARLVQTLLPPNMNLSFRFGWAVAADTDFRVVGAIFSSGPPYYEVAVYSTATGNRISTLKNPRPEDIGSFFGTSVAVSGDKVVVGADSENFGVGGAYVFDATTGALLATLSNPNPANIYFGGHLAISGNTVVVGSDTANNGSGVVYTFNATTGALIATINNPQPAFNDGFGRAVALSGNTLVVSAPFDSTQAFECGEAYIFDVATGALIATLKNPSPAGSDRFGDAVAVSGNTVVVGASHDDTDGIDRGQAYVFNATTGALITTLTPSPSLSDNFGKSVAVSGDTIVVGAYRDDTGADDNGRAFVFDATTGALTATLDNPTPASGDWFGFSVAVSGNSLVVGALFDKQTPSSGGAAYVYLLGAPLPPPVVTSVSPFVGPTSGSTTVVIKGSHFLGVTSPDGVRFGAASATHYTIDSDTQITAVLPPQNPGTVDVIVSRAGVSSSTAGTANDFQYTGPATPRLVSVTPNGNIASLAGAQRSRVASLVVTFDRPVQLDANAMTLALNTNNVTLDGDVQPSGFGSLPSSLNFSTNDNATWIVTFAGNTDDGADGFKSLKDGVYDLKIDASKVHLFGVPSVNLAAGSTTTFHRLFGDSNAPTPSFDGTFRASINGVDNLAFRGAFNKPASAVGNKVFFDSNGDGLVNTADNLQFRSRWNKVLTWKV